MNHALDELYLTWLYGHVAEVDIPSPTRTYWNIVTHLFKKEFVWFVPNDDNRVDDGRYLRYEFLEDLGLDDDTDPDWMAVECSVLEMLIGLSRRLSFEAEGEPRDWFWILMNNLGLRYNDRRRMPVDLVEEVLDKLIWRTYERNGRGGLFPLEFPKRDQREVEIWHQLNSYLLERE